MVIFIYVHPLKSKLNLVTCFYQIKLKKNSSNCTIEKPDKYHTSQEIKVMTGNESCGYYVPPHTIGWEDHHLCGIQT